MSGQNKAIYCCPILSSALSIQGREKLFQIVSKQKEKPMLSHTCASLQCASSEQTHDWFDRVWAKPKTATPMTADLKLSMSTAKGRKIKKWKKKKAGWLHMPTTQQDFWTSQNLYNFRNPTSQIISICKFYQKAWLKH